MGRTADKPLSTIGFKGLEVGEREISQLLKIVLLSDK